MPDHPLLRQLDSCLSATVPARDVQLGGEWSTSVRRTYASEAASHTGSDSFVDVLDKRWRGTITSDRPLGVMAFLLHHGELHWAKSPEISSSVVVDVALHSYAEFHTDRATFASSVGGAMLPGVPVSVGGEPPGASIISDAVVTSGRVICLARITDAMLFAVLMPGELLKMGRKRVWHIRDAAPFDSVPALRALMTHGRTGTIATGSSGT